jgi:peptidyl-prolyl cis-trans isomerase B (cyclophilin B)
MEVISMRIVGVQLAAGLALTCVLSLGCNQQADTPAAGTPAASSGGVKPVAGAKPPSTGATTGGAKANSTAAAEPSPIRTTDSGVQIDLRDDKHPVVLLHTNLGDIVLRLDADKAPRTVYNFMSYASNGHYDQTIFHQVDAGYAVLGGSYAIDLAERPGRYPIPNEATNGLKNTRGTIAMARSPESINSATCEFFINLVDNPQLDHQGDDPAKFGYCVFGEVVGGMSVLEKISKVKVQNTKQFEKMPVETVTLQYVRRVVY